MKRLLDYLAETHGATAAASTRVFCNKLVYPLTRALARPPAGSWVHSRWHWFRFPFSLANRVLWSRALQAWFCPGDESALECMLHLPRYEPVEWVSPRPGDVLLDLGAYVGWYSVWAARAVGPGGRVVALEPDAENARQLESTLALNRIENVRVIQKAAWSRTGPVGWQPSHHPVWHKAVATRDAGTVDAVTVDELVRTLSLPRVDWIKMDVEGGELEALRGAEETIGQFHPVFFIETHGTYRALQDFLGPLGYRVDAVSFDLPPEEHGWVRLLNWRSLREGGRGDEVSPIS